MAWHNTLTSVALAVVLHVHSKLLSCATLSRVPEHRVPWRLSKRQASSVIIRAEAHISMQTIAIGPGRGIESPERIYAYMSEKSPR